MKKTILGAVVALLCSAVFAEMDLAGGTLTFVNKLDIEPVLYTKGSYLPVSDSNVSYGALGTDGFTVLYMPVEGLKITAGLPKWDSYIYNFGYDTFRCIDKDGKYTDKTRPVVNSGVEYTYDESLCLAFIVNDLFFNKSHYNGGSNENPDFKPYYRTTLGFYASFDANKWLGQNLTVNTGYTFMADKKMDLSDESLLPDYAVGFLDCAVDLLSASVEWKNEKFNFAAQGQFRLTKSEYAKDMGYEILIPYSLAFKAGYTVNEKWLAECYLNINKNEEHFSAGEMYYSINPCATYTYNEHHKFRAGLNYNFFTDRWNNTEQKYEDGINNFYVNFGWT